MGTPPSNMGVLMGTAFHMLYYGGEKKSCVCLLLDLHLVLLNAGLSLRLIVAVRLVALVPRHLPRFASDTASHVVWGGRRGAGEWEGVRERVGRRGKREESGREREREVREGEVR